MINIASEDILTPTQACEWLPRRRAGKKTSLSTICRWINAGVAGVRLETIHLGGVRCTSKQALQRFFDAVSAARAGDAPASDPASPSPGKPKPATRSAKQAREAAERAGAEFDRLVDRSSRRRRPAATAK